MADDRRTLTNRQGHPVADNQNQRTVGERGPATLENYQFLEKISHFDRERIPERVVHARGTTSYGYFEAYGTWGDEPISRYTRAKLFPAEAYGLLGLRMSITSSRTNSCNRRSRMGSGQARVERIRSTPSQVSSG
jgi:catalase